jgi:hypothetical protein
MVRTYSGLPAAASVAQAILAAQVLIQRDVEIARKHGYTTLRDVS